MPRYEDLSEQDAAVAWQQAHRDRFDPQHVQRDNLDYFVEGHTHISTIDDTPHYIVALTSSDGVLFALGIETAYQVWQRTLMAWYDENTDPVMISPVTDPTAPSIHGRLNWSIPLCI